MFCEKRSHFSVVALIVIVFMVFALPIMFVMWLKKRGEINGQKKEDGIYKSM